MPWNNQGNNSGGPWGNGSNSGGSGPWGGGNREPIKQNTTDFEKIISDFKSGFGSKCKVEIISKSDLLRARGFNPTSGT